MYEQESIRYYHKSLLYANFKNNMTKRGRSLKANKLPNTKARKFKFISVKAKSKHSLRPLTPDEQSFTETNANEESVTTIYNPITHKVSHHA